MSENPFLRPIKLFHPAEDLAVDETPGARRVKKNPRHPAEGLLGDSEDLIEAGAGSKPVPPRGRNTSVTSEKPVSGKPEAPPEIPPAQAAENGPANDVLGEVPEPIDGDFPEPVDL